MAIENTLALSRIEALAPADLFTNEVITPILEYIRDLANEQAAGLDISTPGNRSDLASVAHAVARSKTYIDGRRKDLVSGEKKRLAAIDAVGKTSWDFLESLQKEIRKPLTDWENAEKDRVAKHEANLKEISDCGNSAMQTWPNYSAEAIRDRMNEIADDGLDWQEFSTKAAGVKALALKQMGEALAKREQHEKEQAELATLRAENAAREQREREERIAREATEKAERDSRYREAKAKADAEAAEARAVKAEQDVKDAAERAEQEKVAAVEAERKRVADAEAAEAAEQRRREKDKEHKTKINNEALTALSALGLSADHAKKVVTAIAQGKIPNVKVVY
jgi:hypothetical protein